MISNWRSWTGWFLLTIALVPAYFGQRSIDESSARTGVLFGLAILMVLVGTLLRGESRTHFRVPTPDPRLRRRWWWAIPAAGLGALAFYAEYSDDIATRTAVWSWFAAALVLLVPFCVPASPNKEGNENSGASSEPESEPEPDAPENEASSPSTPHPIHAWSWREAIALGIFLAVALSFRLPHLERYPLALHNDEANCGLMSRQIVQEWNAGEVDWFGVRDFYHFNTLGFVPGALFQSMFSPNLHAQRLSNVVLSMMALVCFYLLTRDLFGPVTALVGSTLAATAHFSVHWSRSGIHCGHTAFLMVFCGWSLLRAFKTGKIYWFILAGFSLPLCAVTYNAALVVPLWIGATCVLFWLFSSRFRRAYTVPLLICGFAALLAFSPLFATYVKSPDSFVGRSGSMIFTDDPLSIAHMKSIHGEDYFAEIVRSNIKKSVLLFNDTEDTNSQYGYHHGGILDDYSGILFVLGLGVVLARFGRFTVWPIFLGIFLNWLLGAVLTMDSPQYGRIVGLAFFSLALPALWVREFLESSKAVWGQFGSYAGGFLVVCGIALIAWVNYDLYFVKHDRLRGNDPEARFACLCKDMRDDGPENITFVMEPDFPTNFSHRSHRFVVGKNRAAPFRQGRPVRTPTDGSFRTATFVFPLEAERAKAYLLDRFPGGELSRRSLEFRTASELYQRYVISLDGEADKR